MLNRPPITSASLIKCEIKCFLRALDIPYLPQQFNENWKDYTDPIHEVSCIFFLSFPCSILGQLRTLLGNFIWFSSFFFSPSNSLWTYQMMFGDQFFISPGGQSMTPSKLSSPLFLKVQLHFFNAKIVWIKINVSFILLWIINLNSYMSDFKHADS